MDLNNLVNESLAKIEAEGTVRKIVESQLEKTIGSIIGNVLSSYSDFGKNLETEIKDALNVNLKKLNIAGYNVLVLNAVKEKLDEAVHVQGIEKIQESLDRLLNDTKKEYRLSELIAEFKQDVLEDDDDYEGGEISFHIDKGALTFISFDKDSGKGHYACDYNLTIDENGTMTRADIDGKKLDNRLIMGGLYGLDKTLFKIYSTGAKVVIDDDNVDIEYGYRGDD